jgi:hypothetical protein
MKCNLIGIAAAVALAGATSAAVAQQAPAEREKAPGAQDRGSESKGQREPGATQRKGTGQPRASEQPRNEQPRATERSDKDRPKATERQEKAQPKAAERPDKDRPKATERQDKAQPKAAERPDKDRQKAAQPETGREHRVQVSEKQRSDVGTRLRHARVDRTRIDVDVNVGSRVPRTVRLRALPAAIISIAPAYRGYSYFVREDDTIVIVDARTYVIVDVIPAGTERVERDRGRPGQLALSQEQMRFIYEAVPKQRTADVRVRLALGAEVPRSVELLRFPEEVVERVPEVRSYRFIVTADGDVAIVDPADHAVVLVITG